MLLTLGLLWACIGAKTASTPAMDSSETTNATTYAISGKVEQLFPYCGGARPTQEQINKSATPVAYPNKTFYIREGATNAARGKLAKSFTTDKDGLFSIDLPPGAYSIILAEQLNKINANDYSTKNQKVDEKCLTEWWKKPYYVLTVKNQPITNLNFTFTHRCFLTTDIPCINYTGPRPH